MFAFESISVEGSFANRLCIIKQIVLLGLFSKRKKNRPYTRRQCSVKTFATASSLIGATARY